MELAAKHDASHSRHLLMAFEGTSKTSSETCISTASRMLSVSHNVFDRPVSWLMVPDPSYWSVGPVSPEKRQSQQLILHGIC